MKIEVAERWRVPAVSRDQIKPDQVVHAAPSMRADYTLCEKNGPPIGLRDIVLLLDHPSNKPGDREVVNCPVCLEWMHA